MTHEKNAKIGGIQQPRGPNLTQYGPPSPSSGQKRVLYTLSTLCHMTPCGLSTDPPLPLFVHVVIE